MSEAVQFVRSRPSNEALLTDYQSGLVLSFYLCGRQTVLPFGENSDRLLRWQCGEHSVLTSLRSQQGLNPPDLLRTIGQSWTAFPNEGSLWLFQSGWIEDQKQEWITALQNAGCADQHNFGANIRLCQISKSSGQH